MRFIAISVVLLVVAAGPAQAETRAVVHRSAPAADVGLPFWCDWGYDWEERCYVDYSDRLPVGGEEDKVWRAALRFPLAAIPAGSFVLTATLFASFDRVCVGPRKTERLCPARTYTIDAHPVLSSDWFHEREVEIGPLVDRASFWAGTPRRLAWDVTDLVIDWVENDAPNDGLLLKLADGEEDFSVSGPRLPSSEFLDPALRPQLEVTYFPP
jgi:hypothetical protein